MNYLWIVATIIILAGVGARFLFHDRMSERTQDIFLTGWEYFVIGVIIGPAGLSIITVDRLSSLYPFAALELGWAGLIFGAQFRKSEIAKIGANYVKAAFTQTFIVWVGLFFVSEYLTSIMFGQTFRQGAATAAIIGAAGAISSPTIIQMMGDRYSRSKSSMTKSLLLISTLGLAPCLLMVGLVFCFVTPDTGSFEIGRGFALLSAAVIMAGLTGFSFPFFAMDRHVREEGMAALLSFAVFTAGIALYMGLPPIFTGFLTGVILANILSPGDKLFDLLYDSAKPFYVLLLLICGIWMETLGIGIFAGALVLVIVRLLLKGKTTNVVSRMFLKKTLKRGDGMALLSQGALAFAIGLNYALAYPSEASKYALGVIAVAAAMNEIMAPLTTRKVLRRDRA